MTRPTLAWPAPAPLDLAAVRACLAGSGTMLPAAAYTDEAVLAWERRVLFAGGWVCVGRSVDVGRPRSRRAVAVGDDAVLLVRGDDGVLRAFYKHLPPPRPRTAPVWIDHEGPVHRLPIPQLGL